MNWNQQVREELDSLERGLGGLRRALGVARGEEGGSRCGLFALAAITFGGAMIVASLLALALAAGPGR
jgi:hypothetical protein